MTDLPAAAITAATENITAFLLGTGWTLGECAEVAPRLADNIIAAALPALTAPAAAQAAAAERERWQVALATLHQPFRIYDECDHAHTEEDVEQGVAFDTGEFISCDEVYMYSICTECCTEPEYGQTEDCAGEHRHAPGLAICRTTAIVADLLGGTADGAHTPGGTT